MASPFESDIESRRDLAPRTFAAVSFLPPDQSTWALRALGSLENAVQRPLAPGDALPINPHFDLHYTLRK